MNRRSLVKYFTDFAIALLIPESSLFAKTKPEENKHFIGLRSFKIYCITIMQLYNLSFCNPHHMFQ